MPTPYEVGFKDVYPWVWAVLFGVALTLAERRGAFEPTGTTTARGFVAKHLSGVLINVGIPAVLFGATMVRLGPQYSEHMDFWQILGVLYLAGSPLGSHHLWMILAAKRGWLPGDAVHREGQTWLPFASVAWATFAFVLPALAAAFGWRVPF